MSLISKKKLRQFYIGHHTCDIANNESKYIKLRIFVFFYMYVINSNRGKNPALNTQQK